MPEIRSEILIDAPDHRVWDILTDFSRYPEWNPFIVRILGKAARRSRIVFAAKTGRIPLVIAARIIDCDRHRRLSWGGPGLELAKPLLAVEHYFEIEALSAERCRFINGERMDGLLPGLAWPLIARAEPAYRKMNEALKQRAEQPRI